WSHCSHRASTNVIPSITCHHLAMISYDMELKPVNDDRITSFAGRHSSHIDNQAADHFQLQCSHRSHGSIFGRLHKHTSGNFHPHCANNNALSSPDTPIFGSSSLGPSRVPGSRIHVSHHHKQIAGPNHRQKGWAAVVAFSDRYRPDRTASLCF